MDNQSGRGRFVIEPPEVGAVLAGMTMSAGVAEAQRTSPAVSGVRAEEEAASSDEAASENSPPAMIVHASDGSLSPAASSDITQARERQAAAAAMELSPGRDAWAGESRQPAAVDTSPRRESPEGPGRVEAEESGRQRSTEAQRRTREGRGRDHQRKGKAVRQSVGRPDSERRAWENVAQSPRRAAYVPAFSPPPPFPGYVSQGGYVPAAAAGSSSGRARDVQYGVRGGPQQRGNDYERARSRGRSVARQHDARERSPLACRARSRGRSEGRRRREDVRGPSETRGRSRGRSSSQRPDGDRARSRGRSVGAQGSARHRDASEQRRRRSRSRSRSRR